VEVLEDQRQHASNAEQDNDPRENVLARPLYEAYLAASCQGESSDASCQQQAQVRGELKPEADTVMKGKAGIEMVTAERLRAEVVRQS